MPKYKVKVDHVLAFDVVVEAPDEDRAEEAAIEIVESHIAQEAYTGEVQVHSAVTTEDERFDIESVALVPEPKA